MRNLQWIAVLGLLVTLTTWTSEVEADSDIDVDNYEPAEPLPVPMALQGSEKMLSRRKRDLLNDALDAAGSLGIGTAYIKKFKNLINGVPPKMQDAFLHQDFSNVTEDDVRSLNISVIEYLPPSMISKMNLKMLNPIVERLLQANRPMSLGRVMGAMGDKMDSNQVLDKLQQGGGLSNSNEEAGSVLLYTALTKVGNKGGINTAMIRRLAGEGLLNLVPEEQLMRVTDPAAAKQLLNRLYQKASGDKSELEDVDDQALMYRLVETGYGKAGNWSSDTIRQVGSTVMAQMPAEFIKNINPEVVHSSINSLKETKFANPLQAKSVTDNYMGNEGIDNQKGEVSSTGSGINLASVAGSLGPLAAFLNPSLSKDKSVLTYIVNACDQLNLPAPLKAISGLLRQKSQGGKKIEDFGYDDIKEMGASVLKNGPPALINQAIKTGALSNTELGDIAGGGTRMESGGGLFSSPFFQGILAQVSAYAVKYFTQGGKINFGDLPGAFLGALGIKGINDMSNRDLNDDVLDKLKNNPDSLDDAQKAMLLKRLKEAGMMDSADLPPEIRALQPRKRIEGTRGDDILDGLPSDAELRLAHGQGKKLTAVDLKKDKYLIGTMTPKQVNEIDLEEIPAVLAVVRKSKDGPQPQTLQALSVRFSEYIRLKSEDYDSPDKKLLKYISAAEVSKLPATVLAYFIDHRQTSKLPADVRKEIMIAMGELSTKDHATIPGKTREEIILQGLAALDSLTGAKKLDVADLSAIGNGVSDLPVNQIEKLTPVATEIALEIIQGSADDDDDGLKQRACLNPDQKKAWRKKVIELYGEPKSWDPATVTSLCCTIGLLNENDLKSIAPEALATCRCASDSKPPSHLAELKKSLDASCKHELGEADGTKKMFEKVKSEMDFDLDDLESQIISGRRKRNADNGKLNCFKIRVTGTAAPFTKEQLESLDEKEMDDCIYELGVDPLPLENSRVLWKKLVGSKKGSVESLTPDDFRFAGHVLSGITLNDVSGLNLADWDVVFAFGKSLGLSKNVLEKLASQLETKRNQPVSQFNSNDLVITRNILCGFQSDQLIDINPEAFRDALPVLKSLDGTCEQTRISALAGLTMKPEVFGDPKMWSPADVRGIGILLLGLPTSKIETIPAESFIGVTPTVASALPDTLLATLSADQVSNLPRFSAQAMSEGQLSAISDEAREKLDAVIRGPLVSHGSVNPQLFSFWTFLSLIFTAIFAQRIL